MVTRQWIKANRILLEELNSKKRSHNLHDRGLQGNVFYQNAKSASKTFW